jgi:hypothetical protein
MSVLRVTRTILLMVRFYWDCFKFSAFGWIKNLNSWLSLAAMILLAILVIAALFQFKIEHGFSEYLLSFFPKFFILSVGTIFVCRLLYAPYRLYSEELEGKEASENARLPALEIRLPTPPVVNSISLSGNTSESLAGNRQTVISRLENDVVALVVNNCGDFIASQCQARILSITLKLPNEDQALEVVESINVPWIKEDPEGSHVIDIPPNDKRRIWLGGVRQHGHFWLFRDIKALPIEYQQLLGPAGIYEVLLQIDGANIPPQKVRLEIVTSEGPKVKNGFQRGKVSVRILGNENLLTT